VSLLPRAICVVGAALVALGLVIDPTPAWPFLRSLLVAAVAGLSAVLLGVPVGWALARSPGSWALRLAAVTSLAAPPFLTAMAWIDLVGPGGRVTTWVLGRTSDGPSLLTPSLVYSPAACGLFLGAAWAPLPALALAAALRRVDGAGVDAARLAGGWPLAARLLARAVAPALAAGGLAVAVLALAERATPLIAIRNVALPVQAEAVAERWTGERRPGGAAVAALPLAGATLVALGVAALALGATTPLAGGGGATGLPRSPRPRRTALVGAVVALLPAAAPVAAVLLLRALEVGRRDAGAPARVWQAVRLAWQVGAPDALRSAAVGALTGLVTLAVAAPLAWRARRSGPALVLALAVGAAAIPPPLLGAGLLAASLAIGLGRAIDGRAGLLLVVLAEALRALPLAAPLLGAAAARVPAAEGDAARLAGAAPWRLALPALAPAGLAAVALAHALAVGEFGAAQVLEPPGASLLGVFVVNEAHYGAGPELAGLLLVLLLVVVAPLALGAALVALVGARLRGWLLVGGPSPLRRLGSR